MVIFSLCCLGLVISKLPKGTVSKRPDFFTPKSWLAALFLRVGPKWKYLLRLGHLYLNGLLFCMIGEMVDLYKSFNSKCKVVHNLNVVKVVCVLHTRVRQHMGDIRVLVSWLTGSKRGSKGNTVEPKPFWDQFDFSSNMKKYFVCLGSSQEQIKKNPSSRLILGQKSCFLGPTVFEIPQPNWYQINKASLCTVQIYAYDSKITLTPFLFKEVFLLWMRHAEDVNSKISSFDLILETIICGDEKGWTITIWL